MSLLEQLLAVARWKRLVLGNTIVVAVLSVVLVLMVPKVYRSAASIFPPEEDAIAGSALSSLLSATSLASRGAGLPVLATPSDVYAAILKSRTLRQELIDRFDLRTVYKAETTDDAQKAIARAMKVKVGGEGVVTVSFLDRDPKRAADLANASIELLDRMNREKRHTAAGQARVFIASRLTENRRDLAAAEDTLRDLQKSTRVLIPEDQASAAISAAAELEAQLLMKEVDLGVLESQLGPNHPDRAARAREVDELRQRLRELESGGGRNDSRFEIPFRDYPDLSLAYLRVFREVKVQETIYEFLVQQYEQFRIQESRDTPTVHVLDRAVPAERKTKPTRSLLCMAATLLAFLLSSVLAISIEALRRMRDASPERFERLRELLREIGLGRLIARL